MVVNSVLKNVLEKISLSSQESKELDGVADEVVKKIGKRAFVGGSLAKDTLVKKGVQDVDIFVLFDSEKDVGKLGSILKKADLKGRVVHGSRDYYQIKNGDIIVEVVPVVKFNKPEDVGNVTDFSLSHVSYVRRKLRKSNAVLGLKIPPTKNFGLKIPPSHPSLRDNNSKTKIFPYPGKKIVKPKISWLADEIKLAKVFCYANDVYGAESYVQGFSGYALELLVIYFGGFVKFLKGIGKKRIIDIEKDFKSEGEIGLELNESKLLSPVILIDPVYKFRNVCAGLSGETFERFLKIAKKFLKSPSEKFFVKDELDVRKLEKLAEKKKVRFLEINLETDRQEGDIAGTKMKKFFRYLVRELERKKQEILRKEFVYLEGQEAKGYLVVREIPVIDVRGPEVINRKAVAGFKRVRRKVVKRNGWVWAKEKVNVDGVFENGRRVGEEMGVSFLLHTKIMKN